MDVMSARWLRLTVVASLCGLLCALAFEASSAVATEQFGSPGTGAGQLENVKGLGLDQETGDVYAAEFYNERVSKFDGAGGFLFAWGWKVNAENPVEELQTCTTTTGCRKGEEGSGAGEFASQCGPAGVAVDNDQFSTSYKDLYVEDSCNHRVQKFDSSGKFLLLFGGDVNEVKDGLAGATQAEKDVCVAGEACESGTMGTADGEFEWALGCGHIAVGPGGAVYVGDEARVQVFESSGVWRENISLAGLSSTGRATALAVDTTGDVFVKDEGVTGVHEFEADGTEKSAVLDGGSESVEALASDGAGDLLVADSTGGFHVLEYDSTGSEIASFASGVAPGASAMAFSNALDELYVSDGSTVWVLGLPLPGPLAESESVVPGERGTASLEASVNPEGAETRYRFEYGPTGSYGSSTSSVSAGSSFEAQSLKAELTKLVVGGAYHYRIVATNANGTTMGPDRTFTTVPSALIEGPWVTDVTATSVTLGARLDPLGASTEYRFEYGTSSSYGQVLTGNVSAGTSYVTVGYHEQELQPGELYHYRLVAINEVGTTESPDHTFMTQPAGGKELLLPDGRAWELVSPPNKEGALIENTSLAHAASDGSGIVYSGSQPFGEGISGHVGRSIEATSAATVISRRDSGGWRTRDISPKQSLPPEGETATELLSGDEGFFDFSSDLSAVIFQPGLDVEPQAEGVNERTLYLRNNTNETYQPLVSAANVLPGTKYGPIGKSHLMEFAAATPDLEHVVISSPVALTEGAIEEGSYLTEEADNLYEWNNGKLQLINILPDGKSVPGAGLGNIFYLSGATPGGNNPHAISNDGRWVVFRIGKFFELGPHTYYARDMVDEKTVRFGALDGYTTFESMNDDGSKVFYLEPSTHEATPRSQVGREGDLYVFDPVTGVNTELASNAHVQNELVGTSEDGSYVYFVAKGVLASGAVEGEDNLYVLHESAGVWTTTFITVLSREDQKDWRGAEVGQNGELRTRASRVSPDGRYLTFMSSLPLTGYDNRDAVSGQPDEEVFLYDAVTNHLVCASCNPSGARPVGVDDAPGEQLLVDHSESWSGHAENMGQSHWVAGITPPTWDFEGASTSYQSRFLSDGGRLFFDSSDALVPQDTNGLADVYEYEPLGLGDCTSESATFSEHSGGCVGLISSGQSSFESAFFDASENGDDAFFITASKLMPEDYDRGYDVYDAHVCSEQAPCTRAPIVAPECSSGDSCKAAPSPQPALFGSPPSATFSGAGNVVEEARSTVSKTKAKPKKVKKKKRKARKVKRAKKAGRSRDARAIRKGGK